MKPVATYQKLRGGYYTPPAIAHFLAEWAIQSPGDVVLEPSCGDGEILHAAATRLLRLGAEPHAVKDRLYGVELDALESAKASERLDSLLGIGSPIHSGDFFSFCKSHLNDRREYDAIIGNPPFIRYQSFPEEYRRIAFYLMQRAGLHPNRLTNAWVPFLVASTLLLNDDGRLAMVIPAELLQVNYAAELRYFLSRYYGKITLITFRKLLFGGIQQEVVLFLGERAGGDHSGIRTIELDNMDDLKAHELTRSVQPRVKEMDHSTEKWTMYFLDENELALVRRLRCDDRLIPSSYVMNVDVGIVTGMNEFFVLTEDQVRAFQLSPYVLPLVGRSAHLPGAIFSESDWEHNRASGAPTYMLSIPDVPSHALPREVQEYVTQGEQKGFQTGYKCRIRKHWYTAPSIWTPDAFMLRQVHTYPKLVLNQAQATCTDTIHRVKLRKGTPGPVVAAAFLNSLTFAFSEVMGRSYGGGVLELEPNEAERLPLPLRGADTLDLTTLDHMLRKGPVSSVLDVTDEVLLRRGLGMSTDDILTLRGVWEKLRDRRINRKPERSRSTTVRVPA